MAQKKPAAKLSPKKNVPKSGANKAKPQAKTVVKAKPKGNPKMAAKKPVAKATAKKVEVKKKVATAKAPAKKVEAKKPAAKTAPLLKAAGKLAGKMVAALSKTDAKAKDSKKDKKVTVVVAPKKLSKAEEKKLKGKPEKPEKSKGKKGRDEELEDEEVSAKPKNDEDEDDFEEEIKKSLKKTKGSKKAYDEDGADGYFEKALNKKSENKINDLELKISDEIAELREHFSWHEIADAISTLDFFLDTKGDECIERGCDNIRTTHNYCRIHYLKNWKGTQRKKEILKEGKLQEYVEELISKYPPKFIDAILSDLSDDKEFFKVLHELNITSEFDFEENEFEADADDDGDDDINIEARFTGTMRYEDE